MSILKVAAIQNAAGVEVYTAKAWVNFNGTGTVAIRASGNVSSITDLGIGRYQVNYAAALTDANVCVSGMCQYDSNSDDTNSHIAIRRIANALTTAYAQIVTGPNTSNTPEDVSQICVAIFR